MFNLHATSDEMCEGGIIWNKKPYKAETGVGEGAIYGSESLYTRLLSGQMKW